MKRLLVLFCSLLLGAVACADTNGNEGANPPDPAPEASTTEPAPTQEPTEDTDPTEKPSPALEGGKLRVRGVDFAFKIDPRKLAAGKTKVKFTNAGKENHQLVMARVTNDAPTLNQLITLPPKEGNSYIEKGYDQAAEPIPPGESTSFTADFPAGRYVLMCFVSNEDGPHAFHGMIDELMVE